MAGPSSPADLDKECRAMFTMCVEKCAGKELPAAEKSVGKSNAVNKLLKEVFDGKIANAVDATIYPRLCDKTTKKLTVEQFVTGLLPQLAQHNVMTHAKASKPPPLDDPAVVEELEKLKKKIAAKHQEWMNADKGPKNAAVVDRLTDTKGYTGSHKERFDESGKGKGMEGRVEKADNSGYVGNYKGAETYDKTH